MSKEKGDAYFIKYTGRSKNRFVHYNGKEYIMGEGEVGACIFTEANGKELIEVLTGGAAAWKLVHVLDIIPLNNKK